MIDQKQWQNVKYFSYLGSMTTYDARCTLEIKYRFAITEAAFNKEKNLSISKLDLKLRKKLLNCYIWSIALSVAETWTIRRVELKYLKSF